MTNVFPPEIWMAILHLSDRLTLKAARLTCRLLRNLAGEILMSEVTWVDKGRALLGVTDWEQNPMQVAPQKDLWVSLMDARFGTPYFWRSNSGRPDPEAARIFDCIRTFRRLRALTVVFDDVPKDLYHVLADLSPTLKQLTLQLCALPPLLADAPVQVFPPRKFTSNITDLALFDVQPYPFHPAANIAPLKCAGLFSLLPKLESLHLAATFPVTPFLPPGSGLKRLTMAVPRSRHFTKQFFDILREIPRLEELTTYPRELVDREHDYVAALSASPPAPPLLAHLTNYTGFISFARKALPRTPLLRDVCIIDNGVDLVPFVEFLGERQFPLRRLRIEVLRWQWDELVETLRAVTFCLPTVECLEVAYAEGTPSEDPLIELGSEFLPRLTNLEELVLACEEPIRRGVDAQGRRATIRNEDYILRSNFAEAEAETEAEAEAAMPEDTAEFELLPPCLAPAATSNPSQSPCNPSPFSCRSHLEESRHQPWCCALSAGSSSGLSCLTPISSAQHPYGRRDERYVLPLLRTCLVFKHPMFPLPTILARSMSFFAPGQACKIEFSNYRIGFLPFVVSLRYAIDFTGFYDLHANNAHSCFCQMLPAHRRAAPQPDRLAVRWNSNTLPVNPD
ncbi:hypothetical protein C8R46DRAFT_1263114 [Mycena filopes]|nr:hypothetical protein C8R46DRAFT_1263114 [Mycena filopes]